MYYKFAYYSIVLSGVTSGIGEGYKTLLRENFINITAFFLRDVVGAEKIRKQWRCYASSVFDVACSSTFEQWSHAH